MPAPALLPSSREVCRGMTATHARTFYFSSHVLPSQKRGDAYAVYAFCRYVDDRIDLAPDEATRQSAAGELRLLLDEVYGPVVAGKGLPDPLSWLPAFQEVAARRSVPKSYFEDLLTGVEMDRGRVRIETWDGLERYCYHVAGVVGLIMVHVLTEPTSELLKPARDLGTAMQLTNILRDIGEDWERDRVYLPKDEMEKFGLDESDLAAHRVTDAFRAFMRFQIGRARSFYRYAGPGIVHLPRDGSQLTVRLMSTIYAAILSEIERVDYHIYDHRVRVSGLRKIWLAARAFRL